jgi:hypothetical protein
MLFYSQFYFENKVVLVTNSNIGIGESTVIFFWKLCAKCMVTDRNESKNFEITNNAKECHRISISNKRVESESHLWWDRYWNFDEWDWMALNTIEKFFMSIFHIIKIMFHLKIELLFNFLWKVIHQHFSWETLTSILWYFTTRTNFCLSESHRIGIGIGF